MRFHVPGLPHTVTNRKYIHCAFTQKVFKMCKMLHSMGHEVYHYGCEGSNPTCTEHIDVVEDEFRKKFYPDEWHDKQWDYNIQDECHKVFYKNTIKAIKERKGEHDFFLASWGWGHKPIADALGHSVLTIEPGIGYKDTFCQYRVFESYNWMSHVYGRGVPDNKGQLRTIENGSYFDAVIPNYFDPDDFVFTPDEKEDYFLFLGRIIKRKGIEVVQEIAKATGIHVKLAGQGSMKIPPSTRGEIIEYIGFADAEKRKGLFSKAKGLLMPTIYLEPFGGVSIEAMMCVPRGQDILSNGSIKKFEDLERGDIVDTMSGPGIVTQKFKQYYDGEIITIKCANSLPFATTPNHPILMANLEKTYNEGLCKNGKFPHVRSISGTEWCKSEDIQVGSFLVIPKLKTSKKISTIDISQYIKKQTQSVDKRINFLPINIDMMKLFGLYVAEGSVGGHVSLCFGSHEHQLIKTTKKIILSNTPYKPGQRRSYNNGTIITFGGRVLHRFFADQFGHTACEKKIPSWILDASKNLLKSFLLGYIEGDGCHTGECLCCTTSSKTLALQLQKAFSKFDILMSITHDKRAGKGKICGRTINIQDRYLVRSKIKSIFNKNVLNKKRESKLYLQDTDNFYVRVNSIARSKYNDDVFNISTTDGTFSLSNIVSHNSGTPVICSDWGVFPETIPHGVTGYRCRSLDQFVWAVNNIGNIDPQVCRDYALANFSLERVSLMYQEYFEMMTTLWNKKGWYLINPKRKDMSWLERYPPNVTPNSKTREVVIRHSDSIVYPEEKEPNYALDLSWYSQKKKPGISFIMRAKNEQETIGLALDSLKQLSVSYEVNLVLNQCTDDTEHEASVRSENGQSINIFHYPFQLGKTGLENQCTPVTSIHSTIWLLNWMLMKGNYEYTFRWDSDFIMTSALAKDVEKAIADQEQMVNISAIFSDTAKSNTEPYLWANELLPRYTRYSLWHLTRFVHCPERSITLKGKIIHDSPLNTKKDYWETEPWWNNETREETAELTQKSKEKYEQLKKKIGDCTTNGRASCPDSEELARRVQKIVGADTDEIPALKEYASGI